MSGKKIGNVAKFKEKNKSVKNGGEKFRSLKMP